MAGGHQFVFIYSAGYNITTTTTQQHLPSLTLSTPTKKPKKRAGPAPEG